MNTCRLLCLVLLLSASVAGAADVTQPASSPTGPTTAAGLGATAAPPIAPQLHNAEMTVTQVYGGQISAARTASDFSAVATKLLDAARDSAANPDPLLRYVLATRARAVAGRAGDLNLQLAAWDVIARDYRVTAADRVRTLEQWSEAVRSPDDARHGLEQARAMLWDLLKQRSPEGDVGGLLRAARRLAYATRSPQTRSEATEMSQLAMKASSMATNADQAAAAVTRDTATAAQTTAVGEYLLLIQGDVAHALPLLARGSGTPEGLAAADELKGPASPADMLKLADQWEAIADNAKPKMLGDQVRAHAAEWYRRALPGLTGVERARVEKVLAGGEEKAGQRRTTVDLIAMLGSLKGALNDGQWRRTPEGLLLLPGPKTAVRFPYVPPQEYDLVMDVTRHNGGRTLSVLLSHSGRMFTCSFNGFEDKVDSNATCGFTCSPDAKRVGFRMERGRRYVCRIEVRNDHVSLFVDGRLAISQATDYSQLAVGAENDQGIGLVEWWDTITFHKVEVVEVTGHGRKLRR